ncbi:MAG: hypothetical protein COB07_13285 [Sulfurovum sp.]|nr:MAG: hypothetical protein COB07_13285 [Sulfurovum sp.]
MQAEKIKPGTKGVRIMFRKMKDVTLSKAVKIAINHKVKEYGKMIKLNLDSESKTIELELMLDGEKEPLYVKVNHYKLSEEHHRHYLVAEDIVTSRAWIPKFKSEVQFLSSKIISISALS